MEYFLTGATGFLGGELTRQLVEDGHQVVALVRSSSKARDRGLVGAEGVRVVEGDVTEKASMRDAMAGTDGVFHLAAWYRVGARDASVAEAVNVAGTRNVLELMDELGVEKGVYTSTLAVFSGTGGRLVDETDEPSGPFLSVYDRTKWEAHHRVARPMMRDGLPLVVVMPGVIYGPGDTSQMGELLADYLRGDLPAVPRRTAYCWGHVEDTARAHLRAMEAGRPGEDYIVAGHPRTLVEVLELAEEITGVAPPPTISPAWFRALAPLAAVVEKAVSLPPDYRSETLRVLGGTTYLGDSSKARRELGLDHRPLAEGLRETLAWLAEREEGKATPDPVERP